MKIINISLISTGRSNMRMRILSPFNIYFIYDVRCKHAFKQKHIEYAHFLSYLTISYFNTLHASSFTFKNTYGEISSI